MSELTITVSQLNNYIKNIFDAEVMLFGVKVVGEITNLKPSSKAVYFDLKDENAAIPCVVFDASIISSFAFGDKVVAKGKLNYYTKAGKLSFVVSKIEKFGVGDLYKEYLELKEKLQKEGLFDEALKKTLPQFVKRVGVVTSRTGAVIRDIMRVKRAKNRSSDIVLYPVKVQGIGADKEIIEGIRFLDTYGVDVIIVARGGGSFEDYQPFNTEQVVRAVAEAKTPIVSAIGHENDWSLIDFVADKRASTPSVASEMVFYDENRYLSDLIEPLYDFLNNVRKTTNNNYKKILDKSNQIKQLIALKLGREQQVLKVKSDSLVLNMERTLERNKSGLDIIMAKLSSNNPIEVFKRGYTKVSIKGKNLVSVKDANIGDNALVDLADGTLTVNVTKIEEKK